MNKADIFWQTYLNLEKEAIEVSKYIFFTDEVLDKSENGLVARPCASQLETFSPYIADLLVRCCVQIEAISKELYFDIGGVKQRGDNNLFFDEDCLKEIDKKWETSKKVVLVVAPSFNFTKDENKILKPLKGAHKRKGTYWERAYQAVKHDRYSHLKEGNVKAFIHALAALYLLNIYYRNDSWITNFQDISQYDYSMGSAIFSVKAPAANQLLQGNIPTPSESPYVVTYLDQDYQKIEVGQKKADKAIEDYLMTQPEFNEPDFLAKLQDSEKNHDFNPVCELAKYRLNKEIPSTLPFEKRKVLLLKSDEWKSYARSSSRNNLNLELTEDNIQSMIDTAGYCFGLIMTIQFQKHEWLQMALTSSLCKVYIPQ